MTTIPDLDQHVAAIATGDPDAFGLWVAGAESSLRRSLSSLATRLDTEAILQETLLRVWQVASRLEGDGKPNGLLRHATTTARNLAISELRRARVQSTEIEALLEVVERVEPAIPDPRLREIIQRCREALTTQPAAALTARLENAGADPDATLAERLGMKIATFHQNVSRARALLAACLEKNGVDLELELS